jgi:hypothetical protein
MNIETYQQRMLELHEAWQRVIQCRTQEFENATVTEKQGRINRELYYQIEFLKIERQQLELSKEFGLDVSFDKVDAMIKKIEEDLKV